ncbi:MAG: hypothetical protein IJT56_03625 [Clostridia bacterium]|nr:hypothetical protein [Clostridia bacterium]
MADKKAITASFCTCGDTSCPLNPVNHDLGCAPCVAKNLRLGEIPTCFFNAVGHEKPTGGWSAKDFARLIEAAEKDGKI